MAWVRCSSDRFGRRAEVLVCFRSVGFSISKKFAEQVQQLLECVWTRSPPDGT